MPVSRESSDRSVPTVTSAASTLLECALQLEASGLFCAARSAFQAAALSDESPSCRLELAEFQYRTECYAEAASEYESLLRLAAETDDGPLAEVACHNLSAVLRKTGHSTRAMTLQSRATRQTLQDHGQLTSADLSGRALDAIEQDDFSLAENLLLRSLAVETASHSRSGEACDCANLGSLALLRGDTSIGIRFLARAYHIHKELNDQNNAGTDLMNLAEAFHEASRWSLVSRCLTRAIAHFEMCGATHSLQRARSRLLEVQQVQHVLVRDPLLN